MSGPVIPQLGEKLRILVVHGPYADLGAICDALGRKPNTVRWWASGDNTRAPGTIAASALPKLTQLFSSALPDLSPAQIGQVLFGPADDLKSLLAGAPMRPLSDLIAREADRTRGDLFVRGPGLSMVRTRSAARSTLAARVALDQDFRIEFASQSSGRYLVALQSGPMGWGVVTAGFHPETRHILLPGLGADGEPDWMFEENEVGPHLFVAATASRPFPAELAVAASDRLILDRGLIGHFVRNFDAQDQSTRRLFALDLEILRRASSSTQ